jgi:hypothetical protein
MQAEVVKQISQEREHSHKREEKRNTAGVALVGFKTSRWEAYQVFSQIWEVDAVKSWFGQIHGIDAF